MNFENILSQSTREIDPSQLPETDTQLTEEDIALLKIMLAHQILAPIALEGSVAIVERGIPAVVRSLNE